MRDPRIVQLARTLVNYSTNIQKGELCLIEAFDIPPDAVEILVEEVAAAGGVPLVHIRSTQALRALMIHGTEETWKAHGAADLALMKKCKAYIALRGSLNVTENSDVPKEALSWYQKMYLTPVHFDQRVKHTKWCVLRWPTPSFAQQAGMSTRAFEDFYFDVCTMDYSKMAKAQEPLKKRMEATDKVHLKGPGTDLRFSIKGIPAVMCVGDRNIPDGETFTAPVRNSVNGVIQYNTPTLYLGTRFENIRLEFKDGKIVKATGSDTARLNEILDTDAGARYVGEFAIAFHPLIRRPMLDILFDEKIMGSFHFTPGNSYDEAFNGNRSSVHWDMVCRQDPDNGGGEIWFDGVCIRRDGKFIVKDLEGLNPERLLAGAAKKGR